LARQWVLHRRASRVMFYRTDVRYIPSETLKLIKRREKISKELIEIDKKLGVWAKDNIWLQDGEK
tara:strand:- start:1405 stop:1599 length:195 start_codon:yes stop_codon:yes gene_type:complete